MLFATTRTKQQQKNEQTAQWCYVQCFCIVLLHCMMSMQQQEQQRRKHEKIVFPTLEMGGSQRKRICAKESERNVKKMCHWLADCFAGLCNMLLSNCNACTVVVVAVVIPHVVFFVYFLFLLPFLIAWLFMYDTR